MDERLLLIDSIVTTLQNTSPQIATNFIKYAKMNIEDGSEMLRSFGVETLKELDEEQRDLLCRTVAENFRTLQEQL